MTDATDFDVSANYNVMDTPDTHAYVNYTKAVEESAGVSLNNLGRRVVASVVKGLRT